MAASGSSDGEVTVGSDDCSIVSVVRCGDDSGVGVWLTGELQACTSPPSG